MKTTRPFLKLTLCFLVVIVSPFIFSCKNSGTSNSSSKDTTISTTATSQMNNSTARKTDTMSKMNVSSPAPIKWKATTKEEVRAKTVKISEDKNHIYNYSDVMPKFPGGDSALMVYLQDNTKYPGQALDNQKEGTVYVHFVIDETGKVMNPQVQGKPLGYGLDEEAVRVVTNMPDWIPGEVKGKKVKVYYVLPVTYVLSK